MFGKKENVGEEEKNGYINRVKSLLFSTKGEGAFNCNPH